MLAQKNRLTKKKDFDLVFKKGKSSFNDYLGIKILKNKLDYPRFGVIVSSKISKKAVVRNKIKRRIKDVLRRERKNISNNIDCVVITLPLIKKADYNEIKTALLNSLKRLNV